MTSKRRGRTRKTPELKVLEGGRKEGPTDEETIAMIEAEVEQLKDTMTTLELALSSLAEAAAVEIMQATKAQGFEECRRVCQLAGQIAGNARREIEAIIGRSVID